jgi:hypothetical protein
MAVERERGISPLPAVASPTLSSITTRLAWAKRSP